mgnify:CR=1 FL=1
MRTTFTPAGTRARSSGSTRPDSSYARMPRVPGTSAMARMFLDTLLSDAPRATPATYEEISRMLFSRTPADNARTLDALRNAGIYDRRLGGGLLGAQSGLSGSLSGEIVPPQGLLGVRLR